MHGIPVGAVFNDAEHFNAAFVDRSEFYQDFYIPAGFRWLLATEFLREGSLAGLLGVLRDRGREAFVPAEVVRLGRVLPHLMRAVQVHRRVGRLTTEQSAMAAALNELAIGIAFVGTDLRVVWANRAAEAILRAGDGLAVRGRRLCAETGADDNRLRQLVTQATSRADPSGGGMLVTRASERRSYVLLIAPGPEWDGEGHGRPARLLITDPASRPLGLAERARQVYRLTRSEACVVEAVLRGERPEEIAEERGVSLSTVRTQLSAVLAKTETSRQTELVRLLAGLAVTHAATGGDGAV